MKGQVRAAYARTEAVPRTLTGKTEQGGAGVVEAELGGKYFHVLDRVYDLGDGRLALKTVPQTNDEQWGYLEFKLSGGDGVFEWSDADGDLPKAPSILLE